jgi:alpha-beta hydrolase superfamily lysophospholipase
MKRVFLLCFLCAWVAGEAPACPVCNTETGVQVRRELITRNPARNAVFLAAPLIVLGGIVALIYCGPAPWFRRKDGSR